MKRYLTLFFVVATIGFNGLAVALPLNGRQTGEISDQFEVFFTPAGYVFSIWGLIYVLLLGFAIYQLLPQQRNRELIDRITIAFWISSLANMSWLVLWHYEYFVGTLLVMLVFLSTLVWIWNCLYEAGPPQDVAERLLLRVPFSVYVSWVTIATLANLSIVLEVQGLRPFDISALNWAIVMVVLGGLVALAAGHYRRDFAYLAVVLWAFIGIAVKQNWSGPVALAAVFFIGAIVLQILWMLLKPNRRGASA